VLSSKVQRGDPLLEIGEAGDKKVCDLTDLFEKISFRFLADSVITA